MVNSFTWRCRGLIAQTIHKIAIALLAVKHRCSRIDYPFLIRNVDTYIPGKYSGTLSTNRANWLTGLQKRSYMFNINVYSKQQELRSVKQWLIRPDACTLSFYVCRCDLCVSPPHSARPTRLETAVLQELPHLALAWLSDIFRRSHTDLWTSCWCTAESLSVTY